jgi:hypothetical protein
MRFTHFHIKAVLERCCPRVRIVTLCLHVIAITGPRPNSVALSSERMQSVYTQFPYQGSQHPGDVALTSKWVQAIFPLCVCEEKLESSWTLKSIRKCCHETNGRMQLWIVRSFSTLMGDQTHDWAIRTKTWYPTFLSWNLHRIFLEHLKSFSEILLKTLKYMASLIMTATLHDSDFVKQNSANKN